MKIAYLWGVNFADVLKSCSGEDDVYVILPDAEPEFPRAAQDEIRKLLGEKAIGISYSETALITALSSVDPDCVISMGWRRIISDAVLNFFPDVRFYNVHPAILPQYKGYHTEPYVIMNGEREHGITAHRMTRGLDDGGIVHQVRFPISTFSTTASIKKQAAERMPEFVQQLMSLLRERDIVECPQDPSLTKIVAPKRSAEDSEISPDRTLAELFNQIRACDPKRYPAFFYVDGQKVFVSIWRADDAQREHEYDL